MIINITSSFNISSTNISALIVNSLLCIDIYTLMISFIIYTFIPNIIITICDLCDFTKILYMINRRKDIL